MMELLGTELRTDYFVMWEREAEIPWCLVHGNTWHILLPHAPSGPWPNILQARPVTSLRNKDRGQWRWRLEIGPWHLPLGDRHFYPFKPSLIDKFTSHKRQAVCYCSAKPGSEFARVAHRCPLLLVRDDRKEEPRRVAAFARKRKSAEVEGGDEMLAAARPFSGENGYAASAVHSTSSHPFPSHTPPVH